MIDRIKDIFFTPHPYERDVLLCLAWFRAVFVTATGFGTAWGLYTLTHTWSSDLWTVVGIVVLLTEPFGAAILSADFIEHGFKRLLLGYTYNPRVMAAGELEGWTGPVLSTLDPNSQLILDTWQLHKYDVLYFKSRGTMDLSIERFTQAYWEGDPGSGKFGHD